MTRIGITGGIGSGKTTVAHIFEVMGVPVYFADDRAKLLMKTNLAPKIKSLFGHQSFDEAGELNRAFIAQRAFTDTSLLQKLNSVVHPAVHEDYLKWCDSLTAPYSLKEAALLIESGSYKQLDQLIVVTAPLELRIKRVQIRDGSTEEMVRQRIANQLSDEERLQHADFVIFNDESTSLITQTIDIHHKILKFIGNSAF